MSDRTVRTGESYQDQLKKLIPAEVSAAFLAINSVIPFNVELYWIGIFMALLIPICWLYLARLQNVKHIPQLFFTSVIAFPIWAVTIAIDRIYLFELATERRFIPACLLIIVTLISPFAVKGEAAAGPSGDLS